METLDAIAVGQAAKLPLPPVMIYGDDVSHVVTEEGVAYLYQAGSLEERPDALAAVAKATPIGTRITPGRPNGSGGRGWWPIRLIWASTRPWPTAASWPPAASKTWSPGRRACTGRPPSSAVPASVVTLTSG